LVIEVSAEIEAEEIADRSLDAGPGIPVPVAAEHELLQVIVAARGDGEPDVRDYARALRLKDIQRAPGGNVPEIAVSAGAIPAPLLERAVFERAGVAR